MQILSLLSVLLVGCASSGRVGTWEGPEKPYPVKYSAWSYRVQPARCFSSAHYRIFTTIDDKEFTSQLVQVMEGGLSQYRRLSPAVPLTTYPMDCYIFDKRPQWADFTRQHTGPDAAVYLQINRGGYTVRDWFVSYWIGDLGTYSVAAHEGWHQYVARHFKGRIPPFLEEGIACMFEQVGWDGNVPRWNLCLNGQRAQGLRNAIENRKLWPLQQLITMHAGNVVGLPGDRIEAFYAQDWAFARFLWDAEGAKYRPALQQWLADIAAGTVYDPTGTHRLASNSWNPRSVKPMLEHYLGVSLPQVEQEYQVYIKKVAYEEFNAQWGL